MAISQRVKVVHLISDVVRSAYFNALADHCDRDRFDVCLATVPPAGVLNQDMADRRLDSFALDCRSRADYPRAVLRLARELHRRRVDVLQVHLFDATMVGLTAGRLARVPVLIFSGHHSREIMMRPTRAMLAADALASRWLSTHVIVHCQQMKDDLSRVERVPADKIAVIPLGFDPTRWAGTPGERERVRAELGLEAKIVLGAIGRMFWVKDYPRLFGCFAQLAAKHPQLALLVVGDGPDRAELEQLARQLAPGRILFTGSRGDAPDCLAAMDAFVHASLGESFGQVLVEAQLAGLPLLSTRVGIARELIQDEQTGLTVNPGDTADLSRGLDRLLALRDRWREMGDEGRRRAKRYSIRRTLAEHEDQYLEWLYQRVPGRAPAPVRQRSEA